MKKIKMPKNLTFMISIICIVSLNCCQYKNPNRVDILNSSKNTKFPEMVFETQKINFGNVKQDTILSYKYYFTNKGDTTLIIKSYETSCMCTEINLSNDTISPNDSAFFEMKLNTDGKIGPNSIYAVIKSNSSEQLQRLILKANVIIPLAQKK